MSKANGFWPFLLPQKYHFEPKIQAECSTRSEKYKS